MRRRVTPVMNRKPARALWVALIFPAAGAAGLCALGRSLVFVGGVEIFMSEKGVLTKQVCARNHFFEQSVGSNTRTTLSQPEWQLALVEIWSDGLGSAIHLPKRAVLLRSEA